MIFTFCKKAYRILRRKFYWKFRKDYIEKSLAKRKGKCLQCGCCSTCFPPCIHYDYTNKQCKIYKTMGRQCRDYPFDEQDKTEYAQKYCGYYWEDKLAN